MTKKWYVLHTYSGYENKVKKNLETRIETMGLENNVFAIEIPTETVTEIKEGGRRVESDKKVFPGYVLVRMELDDRSWAAVRNTPGVTGFIGSSGKGAKPTPLLPSEIDKILAGMGMSRVNIESEMAVGDKVSIIDGPFKGMMGKVDSIDLENNRLNVLIDLFGQETPVEVEVYQVSKA